MGHSNRVWSVSFIRNTDKLISAHWDNCIRVWHLNDNNKQPVILKGHSNTVFSIDVSSDGKILASGSDDKT